MKKSSIHERLRKKAKDNADKPRMSRKFEYEQFLNSQPSELNNAYKRHVEKLEKTKKLKRIQTNEENLVVDHTSSFRKPAMIKDFLTIIEPSEKKQKRRNRIVQPKKEDTDITKSTDFSNIPATSGVTSDMIDEEEIHKQTIQDKYASSSRKRAAVPKNFHN